MGGHGKGSGAAKIAKQNAAVIKNFASGKTLSIVRNDEFAGTEKITVKQNKNGSFDVSMTGGLQPKRYYERKSHKNMTFQQMNTYVGLYRHHWNSDYTWE